MNSDKFTVILQLVVPQIIDLIVRNTDNNQISETDRFYKSKVYSLLEDEETKLWQLSPLTLYNMYTEERRTGKITFPEG
jgi:hypothetical protein